MTAVYVSLNENNVVVNAVSANTEEEAAALCSYGTKFVKHINGMPFTQGWIWDGEKFNPPAV